MSTRIDDKLLARLNTLVSASENRRRDRIDRRAGDMAEINAFQTLFDSVLGVLRDSVIEPKIAAVASLFPNGSVTKKADAYGVTVGIRPTGRFNVPATLSIQVHPNLGDKRARAAFAVGITPILTDYDRGGSADFALDAEGRAMFSDFLDAGIERFMSDYLAMHEPTSPYQKDASVVDPVCGMSFPKAEAAASAAQGECLYYFCHESCRDRFVAEPDRFVGHRSLRP